MAANTRQQRRAAKRRAAKGQPEPKRWEPPRPMTPAERAKHQDALRKAVPALTLLAALGCEP